MTPRSPIDSASTESRSAGRYAAAADIVGASRLFRGLERCLELLVIAWEASAIRTRLVACFDDASRESSQRVRLIGCAVLSAASVHIALVGIDYLMRPPMVGLGWIVAVPLAVVCIGWPRATVRALASSRVLRSRRSGAA